MSIYYPAGKSSTNPILSLENKDLLAPIIPPTELIFINPNTSYYSINFIGITNRGRGYPFDTQIQPLQAEHPDGEVCELSPSFGLTIESISVEDGGSDHYIGDIYLIYNSTQNNDPAVLTVTEVDENGAILNFDITYSGDGFDNNGIVVSHGYQITFAATFSLNIDKFCISKCIITNEGSGFSTFDNSGLPTERNVVLTNYGSGVSFHALATTIPSYDENNNIIYPNKTHTSNPSILSIKKHQPSFKFDLSSNSWISLNNAEVSPQPKCSDNTVYVAAGATAGAMATLLYFWRMVDEDNRRFFLEELRRANEERQRIDHNYDVLYRKIERLLKKEVSKGLIGRVSSTPIDDLLSIDLDTAPLLNNQGEPIRRWPKPYRYPTTITIMGVEEIVPDVIIDDPQLLEALQQHKAKWQRNKTMLCEMYQSDLRKRMSEFIEELRENPKTNQLLRDFDVQTVRDMTLNQVQALKRVYFLEIDEALKLGRINRSQHVRYQLIVDYIFEIIAVKSRRISRAFTEKTVTEISEKITTKKRTFSLRLPRIKNPLCKSKSRGRGGKAGLIGTIFFGLGLSQAYAESETNEELVSVITDTLLSEFEVVPDSCVEVDRPSVDKSLYALVEELRYLLKKYYLGEISQQELIDQFSDAFAVQLQKFGSDSNTLLLDPQIQQLIQLIEEEDLKQAADDIANETEWPEGFSFPWNIDRQVITERIKRQKMIEFSIMLKEEMINPFVENYPCDDLCGSGSNEDYDSLQEFIGPPGSIPGLTDEDILGLILQLQSDETNAVDNSVNKYFK